MKSEKKRLKNHTFLGKNPDGLRFFLPTLMPSTLNKCYPLPVMFVNITCPRDPGHTRVQNIQQRVYLTTTICHLKLFLHEKGKKS